MNVQTFGGSGFACMKKALGAPDARRAWCKCCDEFSIMCHHEATTNPRYKDMKGIGMNLLLRPLNDYNDVTWSIVISLIILLIGVAWVIKYILGIDAMEAEQHGSDDTPES